VNIGGKVGDSEEVFGIVDKAWVVDSVEAGDEGFHSNVEMSEDFKSGEGLTILGKFCRVIIIISFGIC